MTVQVIWAPFGGGADGVGVGPGETVGLGVGTGDGDPTGDGDGLGLVDGWTVTVSDPLAFDDGQPEAELRVARIVSE